MVSVHTSRPLQYTIHSDSLPLNDWVVCMWVFYVWHVESVKLLTQMCLHHVSLLCREQLEYCCIMLPHRTIYITLLHRITLFRPYFRWSTLHKSLHNEKALKCKPSPNCTCTIPLIDGLGYWYNTRGLPLVAPPRVWHRLATVVWDSMRESIHDLRCGFLCLQDTQGKQTRSR